MHKKSLLALTFLTSLLCVSIRASDIQFPDENLAKRFFEQTAVSLTPVYGVMKAGDDHVATVHGFVDNAQICREFVEALSNTKPKVFSCIKLNGGNLNEADIVGKKPSK